MAVVVPPELDQHPGFPELLRTVNTLASGVSASVRLILVGGEAERVRRLHAAVRPQAPTTVEPGAGWDGLETLAAGLPADDLLVLLSTRRGMFGWSPRLERLPARLAAARSGNLLVAYATEPEAPAEDSETLVSGVTPDRVVRLEEPAFASAIAQLLEGMFDPAERREIARDVVRAEERFSSEVRPGVALAHIRRPGLHRSVVLLGVSAEGVLLPRGSAPAHLVFLLVSPTESAAEHLRSLAALARLVSEPGRVDEILARHAGGTWTLRERE
jgi:mannitol/fructose-specific phosphotransferase system IIA component (Ntr-type)